jgi:hypothetical protein
MSHIASTQSSIWAAFSVASGGPPGPLTDRPYAVLLGYFTSARLTMARPTIIGISSQITLVTPRYAHC